MNFAPPYAAIQKGSILFQQGRYKEAVQIFQEALAVNPNDAYLLHLLANCQYLIPGQLKNALQSIDQSLRLQPDEAYHYQLKALILVELKKNKEALEQINRAIQLAPESDEVRAVQAYIFIKQERWAEAETAAREALRINAENIFAGNMLVSALNMQNKLTGSQTFVSRLLSKDPEDFTSHSSAGWTYLMQGNYPKAQLHFKEALRLNPNFEPARMGMLEAFKAQSKFYQWYLKYSFGMSKIGKKNRGIVILAIYFISRIVGKTATSFSDGPYAVLAYLVLALIYIFFFWTWIAGGLGNLIALADPWARQALNQNERWDAIAVGGLFLSGLIVTSGAMVWKISSLLFLGLGMVLSTIPFAVTFQNRNKTGRRIYGSVGCFILTTGIISMLSEISGWPVMESPVAIMAGLALVLFIATTWLGAFGMWRH